MKPIDCTCYDWNRLRYDAHALWQQGIRSGDSTIIELQYGYDQHDTRVICAILAEIEQTANARLRDYNPEIGF